MNWIQSWIKKAKSLPWLPILLACLGGVVYILHALVIARTKASFLDEGLYLYKGYQFVRSVFIPFADYGVWTNHAILSFLIPGLAQNWFGPGLVTGRYFMIFLSMFTLLGLWVFANRWGGKWWAAGIVITLAINPAEVKIYTMALSEGLVAPLLVWILVLTVGERRSLWELLLGSALTGVLVLTRESMAFVPPLLFLYLIWEHGWKKGLLAVVPAAVVFLGGNAFYFPDNLKFWATRVPKAVTPFLDPWRWPASALGVDYPPPEEANFYRRFLYFWLTIRLHFVALVGALTVWLLWPFRNVRPLSDRMRASIFLSILLIVLWWAHTQAAFFGEFCVSCILLYVGYFDFIGLMLLVVAFPFLVKETSPLRRMLIFLVGALIIMGVGFSTHEDVGAAFSKSMIDWLESGVYGWDRLLQITGLSQLLLFHTSFVILVSTLVVVLFGIGLWAAKRLFVSQQAWGSRIAPVSLNGLLILGLVLSPTKVLGKGADFFDCGGSNVFQSYQEAGDALSAIIPAGSQVYWEGRELALFLYLPDVKIYPPQLNHIHSFFFGGDSATLLRYSQWTDELGRQWLAEADYILIERGYLQGWEKEILEGGGYRLIFSSPKVEKCRWESIVDVYRRVP